MLSAKAKRLSKKYNLIYKDSRRAIEEGKVLPLEDVEWPDPFTLKGLREAIDSVYGKQHQIEILNDRRYVEIRVNLPHIKVGRITYNDTFWRLNFYKWEHEGKWRLDLPSSVISTLEGRITASHTKRHPHMGSVGSPMCTNLDPTCWELIRQGKIEEAMYDAIGAVSTLSRHGIEYNDTIKCEWCDSKCYGFTCTTCSAYLCGNHAIRCATCSNRMCARHATPLGGTGGMFVCESCATNIRVCKGCGAKDAAFYTCARCRNECCHRGCSHYCQECGDTICDNCATKIGEVYYCEAHISRGREDEWDRALHRIYDYSPFGVECRQPFCESKRLASQRYVHEARLRRRNFDRDRRTVRGISLDCNRCREYNRQHGHFRTREEFELISFDENSNALPEEQIVIPRPEVVFQPIDLQYSDDEYDDEEIEF